MSAPPGGNEQPREAEGEPSGWTGDDRAQQISSASPTLSSIRVKLAVVVTLVVAVVATGVGLTAYLLAQSGVSQEIQARLEDLAWSRSALIRSQLNELEGEVDLVILSPVTRDALRTQSSISPGEDLDASSEALRGALTQLQRSSAMVIAADAVTPRRRVVASTNASRVGATFDGVIPELRVVRAHFGAPMHDSRGAHQASLVARVDGEDGGLVGYLVATIDLRIIEAVVMRRSRAWTSGKVVLGARNGSTFHPVFADDHGAELSPGEAELLARALGGAQGIETIRAPGGEELLVSYAPVDGQEAHLIRSDWGLLAVVERDEAYGPVRRMRSITMIVAGILGVALLCAAYVLSRRLSTPIVRLSQSALAVAADPYQPLYDPGPRRDEIGGLARSLRHMREELVAGRDWLEQRVSERTEELLRTNEQLEREIAERVALTEKLRAAKEEAEKANTAKSSFLAAMSHEIRTPLNGIVGMADLLATTPLEGTQREYLSLIQESGETLSQVINDILDFSRIEAGRIEIELQPFNLRELLEGVVRSFSLQAHKKKLELALQVEPEVPAWIESDPWRLRQVLTNLIGNAIKFTEEGEVNVSASAERLSPTAVNLHLSVRDTGIGIPEERLQAIFSPFEQGDVTSTRRFGGAGLGLTIASRLVEGMRGTIEVESTPGQGSTFHVAMPATVVDRKREVPTLAAGLEGMRVLVVDDNATNLQIVSRYLEQWQMLPTPVSDPKQVISSLQEAHRVGQDYRLVILDSVMPDLDGFTLAQQVRDEAGVSPIIMMLSSLDRPDDMRRCKEIGVAAYLVKPVRQSDLRDAIARAFGLGAEEGARQTEPKELPELPAMRVLVAEDNPVSRKLVEGLLSHWGHRVTFAENGRQALAHLRTRSQRADFDIILMDVQMPGLDGLAATRAVRALEREQGGHIPILAMTAHAMKGDRERCLAAGMDGYLAKPIRAQELFHALTPYAPEIPPGNGGVRGRELDPVVDWERARKAVESNEEILRSMVDAFLKDLPRSLAAIQEAAEAKDAPALRKAAHSLKGAAQALAAGPLVAVTLELERAAERADLSDLEQRLSRLRLDLDSLEVALRDYQRNQNKSSPGPESDGESHAS